MFRTNLSEIAKQASYIGRRIFLVAGRALRERVETEFEVLVKETPQYTGSTAASWRMSVRGADDSQTVIKLPKGATPFEKGQAPAIDMALSHYAGNRLPESLKSYMNADIVINNAAKGFDTAEHGPVRDVNTPPGALARFEGRVAGIVIDLNNEDW